MSLLICNRCRSQNGADARFCASCGNAFYAPAGAAPYGSMPQASRGVSGVQWGCGLAVLVVVLLALLGSVLPKSDSSWEMDARLEIEHRVKFLLKNPDSAKFPRERQTISKVGDKRFRGTGIVYSTNGFNAIVPETYICEVQFLDGDQVRVEYLQLGDTVVVSRSGASTSSSRDSYEDISGVPDSEIFGRRDAEPVPPSFGAQDRPAPALPPPSTSRGADARTAARKAVESRQPNRAPVRAPAPSPAYQPPREPPSDIPPSSFAMVSPNQSVQTFNGVLIPIGSGEGFPALPCTDALIGFLRREGTAKWPLGVCGKGHEFYLKRGRWTALNASL